MSIPKSRPWKSRLGALLLLALVGGAAAVLRAPSSPPPHAEPGPTLAQSPPIFLEVPSPRDEFSRRTIPTDDAGDSVVDEPKVHFPDALERDG